MRLQGTDLHFIRCMTDMPVDDPATGRARTTKVPSTGSAGGTDTDALAVQVTAAVLV